VYKRKNIKFIIAGFNYQRKSAYQMSIVEKININHLVNVELVDFIKDPFDLASFYRSINVAVFPGSISITTLEASGCGTPVLLFRSSEGLDDRVDSGRGALFETDEEMVALIEWYAREENFVDNEKIYQQSLKYSWNVIAKEYISEYSRFNN
jgi:glycosyltransferase involved in cell wall biosynthesis